MHHANKSFFVCFFSFFSGKEEDSTVYEVVRHKEAVTISSKYEKLFTDVFSTSPYSMNHNSCIIRHEIKINTYQYRGIINL